MVIDRLIMEYCPNGVEYMPLGEVCDFRNGFAFKSDLFQSDGSPIVRITNITGSGVDMDDVKFFHIEDYPKTNMSLFEVREGDILVAMSGATTGKIGTYKEKKTAYLNQRTGKFLPKPGLNNRFLYHFLLTQVNEMYRMAGGGAQPNLSSNDLKTKIEIPIPSLPVQEEIVRVLDTFTELQAELQAELQKRLQQYNYYRDNLLSFEGRGDVTFVPLNSIANLYRGKVISKDYIRDNEGDFPVYSSQSANDGVMGRISTYMYEGNYLTWTTDGAYAGTVFRRSGKFNITNVCGLVKVINKNVNLDFLFYWLKAEAPKYVDSGMGNPKLMSNVMSTISVPMLPLSEQEKIASILDRFDTLTCDLVAGLPAEIEKRKQQYEYYRDKLLTFKRITK